MVRRQNHSNLAERMAADHDADLTSLCEVDADISCNMQDVSLLQLEKEWTETALQMQAPKVNNFTKEDSELQICAENNQMEEVEAVRTGQLLSQTQQFDFSGRKEDAEELDVLYSFRNRHDKQFGEAAGTVDNSRQDCRSRESHDEKAALVKRIVCKPKKTKISLPVKVANIKKSEVSLV